MKYILFFLITILVFSINSCGQANLENQFYALNNRSELKNLAGRALLKYEDSLIKYSESAKDGYYWVSDPYDFITLLEAGKGAYKQITFTTINDAYIFNMQYNQPTKYWSLEFADRKISIGDKFKTSFSVFYKIYDIIKKNKPTSSDFFNAGLKCFESNSLSSGIDFFKYVVELDSTNTNALGNLAKWNIIKKTIKKHLSILTRF